MYLISKTEKKLDEESIDGEDIFIHRFGKDFNPRIRQKIIDIKQQHLFTSREVKNLLATSGISVNKTTAKAAFMLAFVSSLDAVTLALTTPYPACRAASAPLRQTIYSSTNALCFGVRFM